jgi:CTP:molybdopterin cytidylyltransferase MocA
MNRSLPYGIILAAGKSQRMGRLKPLIKIQGKTFLQHISDQLFKAGVDEVKIVVGFRAQEIVEQSRAGQVQFVHNPLYEKGQFSSLLAALSALETPQRGALVCLGDQPHIKHSWIEALIATHHEHPDALIRPRFGQRTGHPVIYPGRLVPEIQTMSSDDTAKKIWHDHAAEIITVDLDPDILLDADTPGQLRDIIKRMPK